MYKYIVAGDPVIKRGRDGIPLNGSTPPHFCACPNPRTEFPTSYVLVLFVFSEFSKD